VLIVIIKIIITYNNNTNWGTGSSVWTWGRTSSL